MPKGLPGTAAETGARQRPARRPPWWPGGIVERGGGGGGSGTAAQRWRLARDRERAGGGEEDGETREEGVAVNPSKAAPGRH